MMYLLLLLAVVQTFSDHGDHVKEPKNLPMNRRSIWAPNDGTPRHEATLKHASPYDRNVFIPIIHETGPTTGAAFDEGWTTQQGSQYTDGGRHGQ